MSKALLQNPEQQALFDRQGFLVVPFLSPEAVLELDRFFDEMHPQLNDQAGFVSSTYDQDPTYKRAVSDKIGAVFAPVAGMYPAQTPYLCNARRGGRGSLLVHKNQA